MFTAAPRQTQATPTRSDDQVDLSDAARLRDQLAQLPEVRDELVERIKSEIGQGTYETDDKLEIAIGRLFDEMAG